MEPTIIYGGLSSFQGANPEIQRICEKIRPQLKQDNYKYFYPVLCRTQLVEGMNYFIKVHVEDVDKYVHIRVFQALPCYGGECRLDGIELDKTLFDPIDYISMPNNGK